MAGRDERNLPLWNSPWILGPRIDGLGGSKLFSSEFWLDNGLSISRMVGKNGLSWEVIVDEKKSGDRIELAAMDDMIVIQCYRPYLGMTFARGSGNLLKVHASARDIVSIASRRNLALVEAGDSTTVADMHEQELNLMLVLDFFEEEPALSFIEGTRREGVTGRYPVTLDKDTEALGQLKGKLKWSGDLDYRFYGRVGYEIGPTQIDFYYLTGKNDSEPERVRKTKTATVSRIFNGIGELDRQMREGRFGLKELLALLDKVFPDRE